MVALVAAEAMEALGASLARSKIAPQPSTFRGLLHCIMWSTRSWFGQLDPRVGLRMAPWRSLYIRPKIFGHQWCRPAIIAIRADPIIT